MSQKFEDFRHYDEIYVLDGYRAGVKKVFTFAYFMFKPFALPLMFGSTRIPNNSVRYTFGAGPCVAGVAIYQDTPYLFHYQPNVFTKEHPLLQRAETGLIGGSVERFISQQDHTPLHQFARLPNGIISILAERKNNRDLLIRYSLGIF